MLPKTTLLTIVLAILLLATAVAAIPIPRDDELPPRPTLTPTATPLPSPTVAPTGTPAPVPVTPVDTTGAMLQLQVVSGQAVPPSTWSVVQWQTAHGDWVNVTGWRGHFNRSRPYHVSWWVAAENLGEEPFRWVVFESEEAELAGEEALFISEPFALPTQRQTTQVIIAEWP